MFHVSSTRAATTFLNNPPPPPTHPTPHICSTRVDTSQDGSKSGHGKPPSSLNMCDKCYYATQRALKPRSKPLPKLCLKSLREATAGDSGAPVTAIARSSLCPPSRRRYGSACALPPGRSCQVFGRHRVYKGQTFLHLAAVL